MKIDIKRVKIFFTVPVSDTEKVRDAVCMAGAGVIGNYTDCSMIIKCTGTFKPNSEANPYLGENGKLEFADENKVEVVCNVEKVKEVIKSLREVHPYEEPAIDIIPLIDESEFI